MKRAFDILIAGTALLVLSIPLLVVAIWIKVGSPGPVFFRQTRVGRGCRPFGLLKFRSMVVNADRIGGFSTKVDDPRITRVGRILRRTSIDELPQLLNVLRGDMSLVGPRPDVPAQRDLYTEQEWHLRHSVRPGITGLAQISGRSDITPDMRKALDLDYARSPGLARDLGILLKTVSTLSGRGAN